MNQPWTERTPACLRSVRFVARRNILSSVQCSASFSFHESSCVRSKSPGSFDLFRRSYDSSSSVPGSESPVDARNLVNYSRSSKIQSAVVWTTPITVHALTINLWVQKQSTLDKFNKRCRSTAFPPNVFEQFSISINFTSIHSYTVFHLLSLPRGKPVFSTFNSKFLWRLISKDPL